MLHKIITFYFSSLCSFPWRDSDRLALWIARVSRKNPDGSDWYPSFRTKVCSVHFTEDDFFKSHTRRELKPRAVPSIFPGYPTHKQQSTTKPRKSPTKRKPESSSNGKAAAKLVFAKRSKLSNDHPYAAYSSVEDHLDDTEHKLDVALKKKWELASQLKCVKRKVKTKG